MEMLANNTELWFYVAIVIAAIFVVIGLIKKVIWLCVVALVVAVGLSIIRPELSTKIESSVISFIEQSADNLEDSEYIDRVEEKYQEVVDNFSDEVGKIQISPEA